MNQLAISTRTRPTLLRQARARRRALTLVEVMIAIVVGSILVVGLTSVLAISLKTFKLHEGPAARVSESGRVVSLIASDIELAIKVTQRTPTVLSMTVPDRDGDQLPETVLYRFVPNTSEVQQRITYSANPAAARTAVIAREVSQLEFSYWQETDGEPRTAEIRKSDERLLMSHDDYPPPATNAILLVVSNISSPDASELARKSLLESLGYSVTLIGQGASQSSFNAAVSLHQSAYISNQVDASILGNKLKSAQIGILNENSGLATPLGIGVPDGTSQQLSILGISNATHFLAAEQLNGGLSIFDSRQPVKSLSSNASDLARDLKTIGSWNSKPAFSFLNQHDELYMSSPGANAVLGFNQVFPLTGTGLDKMHIATRVTLTTGAKVSSLSAYLHVLGNSNLRFAIYSDKNGEPDQRIAQTTSAAYSTESIATWKTIPLTRTTNLLPGNYWLAIGTQANMVLHYGLLNGKLRLANSGTDPANGMMSQWSGQIPLGLDTVRLSIYANYVETDFAAGRRVQLPWGDTSFDMGSLNLQGKALLKNTVDWASDTNPADNATNPSVSNQNFVAQYFLPALPPNATGWEITRIVACIKPTEDNPTGKLRFALHKATGSLNPGARFQETAWINTSQISSFGYQWYDIPFDRTEKLSPSQAIALVISGDSAATATVKVDVAGDAMTSGTHLLKSSNAGSSWTMPAADSDLRFYVYGCVYETGE
jgi:prepilin-type N-terminal cleavage/methylation domain-containing protein